MNIARAPRRKAFVFEMRQIWCANNLNISLGYNPITSFFSLVTRLMLQAIPRILCKILFFSLSHRSSLLLASLLAFCFWWHVNFWMRNEKNLSIQINSPVNRVDAKRTEKINHGNHWNVSIRKVAKSVGIRLLKLHSISSNQSFSVTVSNADAFLRCSLQ